LYSWQNFILPRYGLKIYRLLIYTSLKYDHLGKVDENKIKKACLISVLDKSPVFYFNSENNTKNLMLKRIASFFLIKENELPQVKYFLLLFVLIGTGLALGRGTADALFFKRYGIEYLPVMYLVLSVALCFFSIIYATVADRFSAEKIFHYLFVTLSCMIAINWFMMSFSSFDVVYPIYFLLYEVASEIFIIHAAHYLSQNFLLVQNKRLAPLIMAGTQVGIVIGGIFLANISHFIGIQNILLIWCLIMSLSTVLTYQWHKKYGISLYFRPSPKSANKIKQAIGDVTQGVRLMQSSKLLKALSLALFFMVITYYIMTYAVNVIYTDTFKTEESLSSFFGVLTAVNGALALLIQVFVTNRAIRYFGAKKIKLWFPVASVASYVGLFVSFTFPFALLASFSKDVIMNAFRNPVRGIIFNAIPENIRGRARATALFIVMPLALSFCGALLWLMQTMDEPAYFVGLGLVAALAYLAFALRVNKAYVEEIVVCLKRSLMMPSQEDINNSDKSIESDLMLKYLSQSQDNGNNEFSKMLVSTFPNEAPVLLLKQLGEGNNAKTDKLIKILSPLDPPGFKTQLWPIMEKADNHLFSTILETVVEPKNKRVETALVKALDSASPRIIVTGIKGVVVHEYADLAEKAIERWKALLVSEQLQDQLAVLELLRYVHSVPYEAELLTSSYRKIVLKLLSHDNARIKRRTLELLQEWPTQSFTEISSSLTESYALGDVHLRVLCVNSCFLLSRKDYQALTMKALNDANARVREAAVHMIFQREENSIELLTGWLTDQNMGSFRAQKAMIDVLFENNVPAGAMAKVITWKTNQLEETQEALDFIAKVSTTNNSALQVLHYTLAEKREQLLDIVLSALRSIESPDIIAVVRSGIHSKDSRYIAQACEVLRDMKNKHLATVLGDILENLDRKKRYTKLAKSSEFTSLASIFSWCQRQSDPWLKECAKQVVKQMAVPV